MPNYNIAFGEKLAEAANFIVDDGLDDRESARVVLYVSLLSTEISLFSRQRFRSRQCSKKAASHWLKFARDHTSSQIC
jgi:hypothetical protein